MPSVPHVPSPQDPEDRHAELAPSGAVAGSGIILLAFILVWTPLTVWAGYSFGRHACHAAPDCSRAEAPR